VRRFTPPQCGCRSCREGRDRIRRMRFQPATATVISPTTVGRESCFAVPRAARCRVGTTTGRHRGATPVYRARLYVDELFAGAAERAYVSCERIVPHRGSWRLVGGVFRFASTVEVAARRVEASHGRTSSPCRGGLTAGDEELQPRYAAAAADRAWDELAATYLRGSEADYQRSVAARAQPARREAGGRP